MGEIMSLTEKLYADLERERARVRELEGQIKELQERLEKAESNLETAMEELSGAYLELRQYREMFPCSVCGKPMEWTPDDKVGQALKAFVKEKHWGHGACVNPQKK